VIDTSHSAVSTAHRRNFLEQQLGAELLGTYRRSLSIKKLSNRPGSTAVRPGIQQLQLPGQGPEKTLEPRRPASALQAEPTIKTTRPA